MSHQQDEPLRKSARNHVPTEKGCSFRESLRSKSSEQPCVPEDNAGRAGTHVAHHRLAGKTRMDNGIVTADDEEGSLYTDSDAEDSDGIGETVAKVQIAMSVITTMAAKLKEKSANKSTCPRSVCHHWQGATVS